MSSFDTLYNEIKELTVSDKITVCHSAPRGVSNPYELLFDSEKRRICESVLGLEALSSDYERFERFVSVYPLMCGCGAAERFGEELSELFDNEDKICAENAQAIWERAIECISKSDHNAPSTQKREDVFSFKLEYTYSKSYLDYVDDCLLLAFGERARDVFCDISKTDFVRGDVYHCEEAYKSFMSGRGISRENEDMLTCGVIYSMAQRLKKEGKALWIYIGNNVKEAKRLLEYLSGRGVLGEVYIGSAENCSFELANSLCFIKNQARVSPVVYFEMGDSELSICKKIKAIASAYPVFSIRYGGILFDAALPSAVHRIVKRGLARALFELGADELSAKEIAERFFESDTK